MAQSRINDGLQLADLPVDGSLQENHELEISQDVQTSFEPIDSGMAAWRMLLSAFVFEALLWGFPLSFGIFQNYYSKLPEYANQPYVSVIGTAASGISYMGAPLIIPLLKRVERFRSYLIWIGWFLCILGILTSSVANTLPGVLITQGIIYGFGFVIFYYPIIGIVNEYWVARRGMAYGILCSSSGLSGVIMPFTLQALLDKFGLPTTLRVVGVALALLTGPLIFLLKGRTLTDEQTRPLPTDWSFLKVPLFWIYTASNLLQGLGYFLPSLYLPSYASTMGMSSAVGALLLAIMSISQVFGQLSFGYLSDRRFPVNHLIMASTLVSSVAILALWGLSRNIVVLCFFAIIYGFFGAGYTAMWARMGTAVASNSTAAFAAFGLFNFGKGLGNVLAGPISARILLDSIDTMKYAALRYEAIVLFSGCCMLSSAGIAATAYLKPWKPAAARN